MWRKNLYKCKLKKHQLSLVGWTDVLKMSLTNASISGNAEEMSFYEQTIHSLSRKGYIQMV